MKIKPFNVIDHTFLPEIKVDKLPEEGDPLEIDHEMYYDFIFNRQLFK